ncbi:MBL fold metallo-hydrolase [Effusibacillus dendaii]|uniref:MBL fold hydrolase n=1 Tax=Effusibacillus dendaii TaxID=2743772 RepID=A0A7I8DAN5_9BACL|nr:MBL fold metallo-hydrolase [Effusibacillus dendaii]BCJ87253.1 MBL fold hydrolase [Effusibacillus dendaii]
MIKIHHHEDVVCAEGIVQMGERNSSVYVFFVDGLLVDTGPQSLENDLISFYQSIDFDSVVLTHSHEDHVGTASWIEKNRNVPIFIHASGVDFCSQPADYPKYRQIRWGIRKEFTAQPLGQSIQSQSHTWKVIYTPGHASDHVALLNENTGILFSGDLFLTPKTKVIMRDESVPVIMNSIRSVLSYDFQTMFCSHAGYIADGKTMLKIKLDDLENLSGDIMHLHKLGLSLTEIDKQLFPKKYPIVLASEGEFDSLHIVRSVIGNQENDW